nr:MAG TPA: hypothetical protein [Caudoviricetes sp.]
MCNFVFVHVGQILSNGLSLIYIYSVTHMRYNVNANALSCLKKFYTLSEEIKH